MAVAFVYNWTAKFTFSACDVVHITRAEKFPVCFLSQADSCPVTLGVSCPPILVSVLPLLLPRSAFYNHVFSHSLPLTSVPSIM